jgi:F-type H+-transporting ATPase subunit alpha
VIDQVIQIFAASTGALDDLKIAQVQPFSKALVEHFAGPAKAIRDRLAAAKALDDTMREDIKKATKDFKSGWVAANPA